MRIRHEAVAIDRGRKCVSVRNLTSGETTDIAYDKLILSPGASPLVPPIPGVNAGGVFTLRNIADMDRIVQAASSASHRRAVVVGAGFIGLEMVEQLKRIGFEISLAELMPQVLP